jgi:hypothetical protein
LAVICDVSFKSHNTNNLLWTISINLEKLDKMEGLCFKGFRRLDWWISLKNLIE